MIINNLFKNGVARALLLFSFLFSSFVLGGEKVNAATCENLDNGGLNYTIATDTTLCGVISNVNNFIINSGATLTITPYDGSWSSGTLTIDANIAQIDGSIILDSGVTLESNSITDIDLSGTINLDNSSNFSFPGLTNLTIKNGGYFIYSNPNPANFYTPNLANMTIKSGGTLTHNANTTSKNSYIDLTLNNLTIEAGGKIDVSKKGYSGGAAQQNGVGAPSTNGGGIYTGSGSGIGGTAYGSVTVPNEMGSGGSGSRDNAGGTGGGYIKLNIANTLTVSGLITANGGDGGAGAGGGAGGGIYIIASTIAGSGSITANGGNGGSSGVTYSGGGAYGGNGGASASGYGLGGAGGGGRIAIYYTTDSFTGAIQAYGGTGYQAGGAGTIYKKSSTQTNGILIVDNNVSGADTPLAANITLDDFAVQNSANAVVNPGVTVTNLKSGLWNISGGIALNSNATLQSDTITSIDLSGTMALDPDSLFNFTNLTGLTISGGGTLIYSKPANFNVPSLTDVTVKNNGTLTHNLNTTSKDSYIDLTLNNLTIEAGGKIDVSGKGYAGGVCGDGYVLNNGGGYGTILTSWNASGGGNGGVGGVSLDVKQGGMSITSSLLTPDDFGSGGGGSKIDGSACTLIEGGSGGGLVKLTVNNILTLNGDILSNGSNGLGSGSYYGGGGAAGSIYLQVNNLSGAGKLQASGGSGFSGSGGGGGGIIAIYYTTDNFTGTIQAYGGDGYQAGGAGTIYLKDNSATRGKLILDNNNLDNSRSFVENSEASTIINSNTYDFENIEIKRRSNMYLPAGTEVTFQNSGLWNVSGGIILDSGTKLISPNISEITTNSGNIVLSPGSDFVFPNLSSLTIGNGIAGQESVFSISKPSSAANEDFYTPNLTDVTIKDGGTLTHNANTSTKNSYIDLTLNNLTVEAGGKIDVSGKGYAGGEAKFDGNDTIGGGKAATSYGGGGGGGYGGSGGLGSWSYQGGDSYGSLTNPDSLGSGGGGGWVGSGGAGGGLVKLMVNNTLTLDGDISANGNNGYGNTPRGGGGSGGSVFVVTDIFNGTGSIKANGGSSDGSARGGGGGGGRIAYYYNTKNFIGTMEVYGGSGYNNGDDGTIYEGVPPEAINLSVDGPINPCQYNNQYQFSWTYVSNAVPPSPQSAYRIRIPVAGYDSGKIMSGAESHLIPAGILEFNTTYSWELMVWDSTGIAHSEWTNGPDFTTISHRYPESDFSVDPPKPDKGVVINFTNDPDPGVDGDPDRYGPYIWEWCFDTSNNPCLAEDTIVGSTSAEQNPSHTYDTTGSYTVRLKVTDKDGYICSTDYPIGVKAPPKWNEVSPGE